MTDTWAAVVRLVEARAAQRCEYCQMHQSLQGATFHVEHIIPSSEGGSDIPDNLAWACPGCNLKKSNRRTIPDPDTGQSVPVFNPRKDVWVEHFSWNGYALVGRTPVGRALIEAFDLNHPRRMRIRQAEEFFGLFPS